MKPLIYIVPPDQIFTNDELFTYLDYSRRTSRWSLFRQKVESVYDVHTIDHFFRTKPDVSRVHRVFFLNLLPFNGKKKIIRHFERHQLRLILSEPAAVNPYQFRKSLHKPFERIYTWDDRLIDGNRYRRLYFSVHSQPREVEVPWSEKKFCTIMAANKISFHAKELYSIRYRYLTASERLNTPIDLYGTGWNRSHSPIALARSFAWQSLNNRQIYVPQRLIRYYLSGKPPYSAYKGKAEEKEETLSQYKFTIATENQYGVPGYVTEKIWEAMLAKTVPVYLGASNVDDYVPKDAYIDAREFENEGALVAYLSSITEEQYREFRRCADRFLDSPGFYPFTHEAFLDTLLSDVHGGDTDIK